MSVSLNVWDSKLIERHLGFYEALEFGQRVARTPLQAHFIATCRGDARPTTQHEIAYRRYRHASMARLVEQDVTVCPSPRVERVVDWIDAQAIEAVNAGAEALFHRASDAYRRGSAKAKRASTDAAILIQAALADGDAQRSLASWTAERFDDLSNIYTKAMDGSFADGLKGGADYVAPCLHRIFEGHTIWEAWSRVCDASGCDSGADEFWGFVFAYASDLATQAGMPIASISSQSFEALAAALSRLGVDKAELADLLTFNLVEVVAAALPILSVLHGWSMRDAETFARLAGGMGLAAVVSANPLAILVALACLAKAFTDARGELRWRGLSEGVARSGIVMGTAAAVGGPAILGVVAGVAVALVIRHATTGGLSGFAEQARFHSGTILRTVADAATRLRAAPAFARGGPGTATA